MCECRLRQVTVHILTAASHFRVEGHNSWLSIKSVEVWHSACCFLCLSMEVCFFPCCAKKNVFWRFQATRPATSSAHFRTPTQCFGWGAAALSGCRDGVTIVVFSHQAGTIGGVLISGSLNAVMCLRSWKPVKNGIRQSEAHRRESVLASLCLVAPHLTSVRVRT